MGERSVRGKVVLITGGAEGIGREIARNYLAAGASVVVLVDVNDRLGRATAAELNSTHGPGKAAFIRADVTSEKDLDSVYARVQRDYDHLDVLVNNAGILDENCSLNDRQTGIIDKTEREKEDPDHYDDLTRTIGHTSQPCPSLSPTMLCKNPSTSLLTSSTRDPNDTLVVCGYVKIIQRTALHQIDINTEVVS
ncbi:3-beta-hydroxysteroid dehydrogenase [Eumeta japonica]|uniref:15-hydroxyprostaglandin dehydrogenase [NAD(+)] n=1 Tax=Eumeta variegata TaxID=151549 RepID=A0A4C1Z2E3_EUMVA|nr:3-beta-hydroxysteroid dehydrogenase [Eumeta japonica]